MQEVDDLKERAEKAWLDMRNATRKRLFMVPEMTKAVVEDAKHCKHRPDGERCRQCRLIVEEDERVGKGAEELRAKFADEFGQAVFDVQRRKWELRDAVNEVYRGFWPATDRRTAEQCDKGEDGTTPCARCDAVLGQYKERDTKAAVIKKQFADEFGEEYTSGYPEYRKTYRSFWDYATENKDLWVDEDEEKEIEKARKLWAQDDWEKKRKECPCAGEIFEDFWDAWKWHKGMRLATRRKRLSSELTFSTFWDEEFKEQSALPCSSVVETSYEVPLVESGAGQQKKRACTITGSLTITRAEGATQDSVEAAVQRYTRAVQEAVEKALANVDEPK